MSKEMDLIVKVMGRKEGVRAPRMMATEKNNRYAWGSSQGSSMVTMWTLMIVMIFTTRGGRGSRKAVWRVAKLQSRFVAAGDRESSGLAAEMACERASEKKPWCNPSSVLTFLPWRLFGGQHIWRRNNGKRWEQSFDCASDCEGVALLTHRRRATQEARFRRLLPSALYRICSPW